MGIITLSTLSAHPLFALPIYRTMISAKKGILVNCTLCHQSDIWELNKYGKDFLKGGHDFRSLETLESLDSDQDGFTTSEEWKFQSNPGDPASTPKRTGNWLKESKPTFPPKKILAPLFPGTITYRVQEDPLSENTINDIEKILGRKLHDEEKYPTLFLVQQEATESASDLSHLRNRHSLSEARSHSRPLGKNEKTLGVAVYSIFHSKGLDINVLLTVTKQNRILKLHPQHLHLKALASPHFLKQFSGKRSDELSHIQPIKGWEKESQNLMDAVRNTLIILERSFP